MRLEDKGAHAGGHYIACGSSRRGLGCAGTTWKLRDFEASFLSYVREVQLALIERGESEADRRGALDDAIAACRGELASLRERMMRTDELLDDAEHSKTFILRRLEVHAARETELERELRERETERASLDVDRAGLEEIRSIVERLQDRKGGDDVYKLRSQVAMRLRSLVTVILVATIGRTPITKRAIELARSDGGNEDVVRHLEDPAMSERDARRYFSVAFKDGMVRVIYPSRDDPMMFEEQLVSSDDEGLVRVTPEHEETIFTPTPPLLDLTAEQLLKDYEQSIQDDGKS
jgi:hypothetical protein